jgi:hypothetical protein
MSEARSWVDLWTHPLLGLALLFVGLALGTYAGDLVSPVQDAVDYGIGLLTDAAAYVILFTVLPALLDLFDTSGGRAPLVVLGLFAASSIAGGLYALVLSGLIFQLPLTGGASGGILEAITGNLDQIGLAPPILGVFWAFGGATLLHAFILLGRASDGDGLLSSVGGALGYVGEATRDIFLLVFDRGVEGLGAVLEYLLPILLFSIGTFVPVSVDRVTTEAGAANVDFNPLTWYLGTSALVAVATIVFLLLVAFFALKLTGRPARRAFREYVFPVYAFAWSSASSAATIPINLEKAEKGLDAREGTRGFVIPLGATVNLDGTLIATLLITPVVTTAIGYPLTFPELAASLIPLLFLTVGAPGLPAGMSILAPPVLAAVLALEGATADAFVALWFAFSLGITDQFRTAVNSVNNGFLTLIAERVLYGPEKEYELEEIDDAATPA